MRSTAVLNRIWILAVSRISKCVSVVALDTEEKCLRSFHRTDLFV